MAILLCSETGWYRFIGPWGYSRRRNACLFNLEKFIIHKFRKFWKTACMYMHVCMSLWLSLKYIAINSIRKIKLRINFDISVWQNLNFPRFLETVVPQPLLSHNGNNFDKTLLSKVLSLLSHLSHLFFLTLLSQLIIATTLIYRSELIHRKWSHKEGKYWLYSVGQVAVRQHNNKCFIRFHQTWHSMRTAVIYIHTMKYYQVCVYTNIGTCCAITICKKL